MMMFCLNLADSYTPASVALFESCSILKDEA